MPDYRRNHYVPVWYQSRFIPLTFKEKKYYYLDLKPEIIQSNGHKYTRNTTLHRGPKKCFEEENLYTTRFGTFESTEIEEKFFGAIDLNGQKAVEYFSTYEPPDANPEMFNAFLLYMSTQKLRTPKGLDHLKLLAKSSSKNELLFALQRFQNLFCAIWSESVWSIADASMSETKFLVSDHPVTVYNQGFFPGSNQCRIGLDPEIWQQGTHSIFPLSSDKVLILTNLSWVRNPYGDPKYFRPNHNPFRNTIFNFLQIQTGRHLSEYEVIQINYIIKNRARRYIASSNTRDLFPESRLNSTQWDLFGKSLLLMPDPRSLTFTSDYVLGFSDNHAVRYDEYGRVPNQKGFLNREQHDREWKSFLRFQAEFAKRFGPTRRGVSFEFGEKDHSRDSDRMHQHYLQVARQYKDK